MAFARAPLPSVAAVCSQGAGPKAESACLPDGQGDPDDLRQRATLESGATRVNSVVRLKKRSEFLAVAATGRRWIAPAFVLQTGPRIGDRLSARAEIGLGFTATKRLGNAVARNRAKRRLREAARRLAPSAAPGHDYVLIARADVLTCAFQTLLGDLETAFSRVLTSKPRPRGRPKAAT